MIAKLIINYAWIKEIYSHNDCWKGEINETVLKNLVFIKYNFISHLDGGKHNGKNGGQTCFFCHYNTGYKRPIYWDKRKCRRYVKISMK